MNNTLQTIVDTFVNNKIGESSKEFKASAIKQLGDTTRTFNKIKSAYSSSLLDDSTEGEQISFSFDGDNYVQGITTKKEYKLDCSEEDFITIALNLGSDLVKMDINLTEATKRLKAGTLEPELAKHFVVVEQLKLGTVKLDKGGSSNA